MVDSVDIIEASIGAEDKLIWLLSQGVDDVLDIILSVLSMMESLWNDDDADIVVEFDVGFWSQYIEL